MPSSAPDHRALHAFPTRRSSDLRYQDDGRYFADVELVEGSKPSDTRVVYRIVEGPVVSVAGVEFRGNDHGQTGRLKTQLATKRMVRSEERRVGKEGNAVRWAGDA